MSLLTGPAGYPHARNLRCPQRTAGPSAAATIKRQPSPEAAIRGPTCLTVVATGASGGIGLEVARAIVRAGADAVLGARYDQGG